MMKKIQKRIKTFLGLKEASQPLSRTELEKKVIQSAKQVVKDYPGVFERLAKYDRV